MNEGFEAGFSLEGFPAFLLICAVMVALYGIPAMRIVRRVGFAPGWGLLAAIPLVNIVALWVFAYRSWPADRGSTWS